MTLPSLYVHVPFCVVKCGYCDFTSYVVEDRRELDRFLDGLDRELEVARPPRVPSSVFIGGGTPTHLEEPRFERLLQVLARHVDLAACREVTIEANPESVTVAKARLARAAGVRRVSVGAQSFSPRWLRFLDRAHSAEQTRAGVAALREGGFENLSLDLMFGLPGQTLAEWRSDLDAALELGPDHLSCYNLTFEPGTRLGREHTQGHVQANAQERDRAMLLATRERLREAGFEAYEISNFAGRGGRCRHNDHYWLQGDYIGVGPGAASHRQGVRSTNLKVLHAWASAVERGLPPVAEAETLTPRQRAAEALWLGIRRSDGIDVAAIEARLRLPVWGPAKRAIDELEAAGLVDVDGRRVRLSEAGLPLADSVGERLLGV